MRYRSTFLILILAVFMTLPLFANPFIGKWNILFKFNNQKYQFEFFEDGTFTIDYLEDYKEVYQSLYFLDEEKHTIFMDSINNEYVKIDDNHYKLYYMFNPERNENFVYLMTRVTE